MLRSDDEDSSPKRRQPESFPRLLEPMSVEAMREYLEALEAEKARVHAEIATRGDARSKAESLFK